MSASTKLFVTKSQSQRISDMICRTKEIEIPKGHPFLNCKLNRESYASILTKVVAGLNEGGVLSICGEWGTGKTTFVKMWEQQLKNNGFQTLYFNVWEHDFISDPLIGIITQFRSLVPNEGAKQTLATISKSFISIITGMAPKIAKGVATRYLGEDTADILEAGAEKASESFNHILDEFEEQSNSISEFKSCLANYVEYLSSDKPVVFIIDELDRCNPHYAVKTLERIKHLFNIPGIIFVLSVDKEQLCNSIRGYFGSEQLNAEEYLKRFIDFEYQLPKPDLNVYCNHLYDLFNFSQFFNNESRRENFRNKDENEEFLLMATTLFTNLNLNLRQIAKQFIHLRIAIQSFGARSYVHPGVIVLLEYLRHKHYVTYNKIYNKEFTIDELVAELEKHLPHNLLFLAENYERESYRFVWEIAKLLCCYAMDDRNHQKTIKLISDGDKPELLFNCEFFNKEKLVDMIKYYDGHEIFNGIFDIRILMDHLELLNDFSIN